MSGCLYCLSSTVCSAKCSDYMPDCASCSSATQCLSCFTGQLVTGGCTTITGCTQVDPTSTCLQCQTPEFTHNININTCSCSNASHTLVNRECVVVDGCLATRTVNGAQQCISCNMSVGLSPQTDGSCACQTGYQYSNSRC